MSADSTTPGAPPLEPGTRVDHFSVTRPLARGGMGEVYLARDTVLGRDVALKVIASEHADAPDAVERLLAEARATAAFSHPHIVTVFAAGVVGGRPYLALEYLEGQTLRERLREERPSLRVAVRIGAAVAAALAEAHRRGILHRDLKPANVMIPQDGRPRVVDFGLARALPAAVTSETPSLRTRRAGTAAYLAPETWAGGDVGPPADVWALGVVLAELVHGRRPYADQEDSALSLYSAVTSPLPPPLPPPPETAPPELVDLLARCLAKDPAARPSAAAAQVVLERLARGDRRSAGDEERSPFRGLLPFSERDADLFYGRDAEVDAFLERLREQPVLPVVGPSGAGKSSFVRAGVLPRLREQAAWLVLQVHPGRDPFAALAARLVAHEASVSGSDAPTAASGEVERPAAEQVPSAEDLAAELRAHPERLNIRLHALAERASCRVLLLVDPLEQLDTHDVAGPVRQAFMEAVCGAGNQADPSVRVVLVLRDDFLGRLAGSLPLRAALGYVTVLRALGSDGLREALTEPLRAVGYRWDDPGLVERMIGEVTGETAALPLAQFCARALWDRRDREARTLRAADYTVIGGVAGALADHADAAVAGLPPESLAVARRLLLRLVTPDGTRRVLERSELLADLPREPAALALGELIAARLVVARRERAEAVEVELAHESLIASWDRLRAWIDEEREELRALRQLEQAAAVWVGRGRREDEVWSGEALRDGLRAIERARDAPSEAARRFLAAGQRRVLRHRRRRWWLVAAAFAALAIFAVVSLVVAAEAQRLLEREATERARAQREAAEAAFARGDHVEARAKLRLAVEERDNVEGRVLFWRLSREPVRWRLDLEGVVYDAQLSPDERTVAVAARDPHIRLVDTETLTTRRLRGGTDQVLFLAWSADGRWLAAADWGGSLRVWDVAPGVATWSHRREVGFYSEPSFAPDGRRLAAGATDGSVVVWEWPPVGPPRTLEGTGTRDYIGAVAWSADGSRLVATGGPHDPVVRVWDTAVWGAPLFTLRGHFGGIDAAVIGPDGRLATSSHDRTVRLWHLGAEGSVLTMRHLRGVDDVTWLGLDRLASVGRDDQLRVWSTDNGAPLGSWEVASPSSVDADALGERLVISGGMTGQVTMVTLARLDLQGGAPPPSDVTTGLAFAPSGSQLVAGSADGRATLWDEGQVRPLRAWRHDAAVAAVAVSPDGRILAMGGVDGSVLDGSLAGAAPRLLGRHASHVADLAFAAADMLVSVGGDGFLVRWDLEAGAPVGRVEAHSGSIHAVALDVAGGRAFTAADDGTLGVMRLAGEDGVTLLRGHEGPVRGVAFGGGAVFSGSEDGTIRRWEQGPDGWSGRVLADGLGRVYWLGVDLSGTRIAAPLADGSARILDAATGAQLAVLRGHADEVAFARFDPAGEHVATTSDDGTVRVWNARTGAPAWWGPSAESLLGPFDRAGARWRAALAAGGRALDVRGSALCLGDEAGRVALWDHRADRELATTTVGAEPEVVALEGACVAFAAGRVTRLTPLGAELLAEDATALGRGSDGALVATAGRLRRFGPGAEPTEALPVEGEVIAVAEVATALVVALADGRVILALGERHQGELREEPEGRVTRLAEGPGGTLVVGTATGQLGVWSPTSGRRLLRERLHGAVRQLLVDSGQVHASTELGDSRTFDLGLLDAPRCELLRAVWEAVPVVWQNGRPVRMPPPEGHACHATTATQR